MDAYIAGVAIVGVLICFFKKYLELLITVPLLIYGHDIFVARVQLDSFHALIWGAALGVTGFLLSLALTTPKWRDAVVVTQKNFFSAIRSRNFFRYFALHVATAFYEEVFWRVYFQGAVYYLTQQAWIAVAISSVLFWLYHPENRKRPTSSTVEFAAFSIFLGAVFEISHSLVAVVLIHLIRNVCVLVYRDAVCAKSL
jgi:membrane protease YdiL (CAAX protease family)